MNGKKLPHQSKERSATGKTGLPFVFLNLAMTADGKIAPANRKFITFSSERDREHMMELRAQADAVMSGARTVDMNPVTLGTGGKKYRALRIKRRLPEYNLRIIVSGSGSLDPNAKIFKKRFSPILVLTHGHASAKRLAKLKAVADEVKAFGDNELDFKAALRWLKAKWGVKRLLCEGGGEIDEALFRAGLVDELHLTLCPKIMGGRHAPTIADGLGVRHLSDATQLTPIHTQRRGDEMFLVYRVRKPAAARSSARKAIASPKAGSGK